MLRRNRFGFRMRRRSLTSRLIQVRVEKIQKDLTSFKYDQAPYLIIKPLSFIHWFRLSKEFCNSRSNSFCIWKSLILNHQIASIHATEFVFAYLFIINPIIILFFLLVYNYSCCDKFIHLPAIVCSQLQQGLPWTGFLLAEGKKNLYWADNL